MFRGRITSFHDPASIRVTSILRFDSDEFGIFYSLGINARNQMGGIAPNNFYLFNTFFGTREEWAEQLGRRPFATQNNFMRTIRTSTHGTASFDLNAINAAIGEFVREQGWS